MTHIDMTYSEETERLSCVFEGLTAQQLLYIKEKLLAGEHEQDDTVRRTEIVNAIDLVLNEK